MGEDNLLQVIDDLCTLTPEELLKLSKLREELQETIRTVQRFRTRTEMRVSVLKDSKHPTPDAKYWQAVREQKGMFDQLVLQSFEYRKILVKIKKLKRSIENEKDELERESLQIDLEKNQYSLGEMRRTAQDRLREILEWSDCKKHLRPYLKYGTEDVDKHQFEAMTKQFAFEASLINDNTPIGDKVNIIGKMIQTRKEEK